MSLPTTDPAALPEDTVLVDVRRDDEWDAGHAATAVHVPLDQLPERAAELPTGQLHVICRSGARSAEAVKWLLAQGREAVNVSGGMQEWAATGRAVVNTQGEPGRVI